LWALFHKPGKEWYGGLPDCSVLPHPKEVSLQGAVSADRGKFGATFLSLYLGEPMVSASFRVHMGKPFIAGIVQLKVEVALSQHLFPVPRLTALDREFNPCYPQIILVQFFLMYKLSSELRLHILFGLFICCLIGMNVLGGKLIPLGPFSVSVAFLIVPWSFLLTDIVEEVYGKKKAKEWVIAGVVSLIAFLIFILLFVALPPSVRFTQNEEYNMIFGTSARIVFASITAFLLSQYTDVWTFWLLREKTKKRFLWFRTNVSTVVSMVVDTFVFMYLAFYMLTPTFTAGFVLQMIIPYLMFKVIWGFASTPLVYIGARWLKAEPKRIKN
jgi:uncharacterized integral membrane protein (TIGR00697 family)